MKVGIIVTSSFVLICSALTQDTVHLKTGWNVIGSVKAGAVPEVLSTIPESLITSSFWGYAPGVGYQSTATLETGSGYWVKAKSDGLIVFNNVPPADSCKSKAFIYEGKLYHTVLLGTQCWMAENLDVGVMIDSLQNGTDNDTTEKYCYYNDPLNCVLYGGLYLWNEAMQYTTTPGTQGICPTGWHIPTYAEFQTLRNTVSNDGNALKALGQGSGDGAGTNTSGFSSLFTGFRHYHRYFSGLEGFATFWSSTEFDEILANPLGLDASTNYISLGASTLKVDGFSVRCLED